MANLTRNLFIPYVDANTLRRATGEQEVGEGHDFVQIDKSTIFELSFNPQETTSGYIDEANDTTYVTSYQPELPQEIILDSSNPLYRVMFPFCMNMPTGGDAVVPVLLRTPNLDTDKPTDGMLWENAIVSPSALNTVDGLLTFSLKLNGDAKRGTVTDADGVKFTEGGAEGLRANPVKITAKKADSE